MARLTEAARVRNETAIRAATEQLLGGHAPEGARCDLKTLAAMAGVPRTGFSPKKDRHGVLKPGTYQHLAEEFERRREALLAAGVTVDPRAAQIDRLRQKVDVLHARVTDRDEQIADLTAFKTLAVSRLAAQHEEIERLRAMLKWPQGIRRLPREAALSGDNDGPVGTVARS
jgi:hypothetical protein